MEKTNYLKEFAKYVSLNVLGMLSLSCYILADTFFISKGLGADGLTALNLAIPIFSFISGSGLMIGMGGATLYAIQRVQGKQEACNEIFTHGVYLMGIFAGIFVLTGLLFSGKLMTLFGGEGSVHAMAKLYTFVILLFSPAFLTNNLLICFVRNDGAPQRSMAAMITGSLSNVVLDWIFIFPCQMGIFGAVFATCLAPIISMAILSPHFRSPQRGFHLCKCRLRLKLMGAMLSCGLPSLITEVSSGVVIIVFNYLIMSLLGNIGVAAYGVIANLSLVVLSIYTGIAQGIQPIISRGYGRGSLEEIKLTLRYAIITMLAVSILIYGVVFFGNTVIAGIFNSEGNQMLQSIAEEGLRIYFIACPFAGFNVIACMYFTSTGKQGLGQTISLLRGFIFMIPLAIIFSFLMEMTGIWCAFPVAEALTACICSFFFLQLKKASQ